ncbi:unnamed protein product [Burkholderia pseudomallei]|nr:unnamed protein product [Burkholderia pseudomallei]
MSYIIAGRLNELPPHVQTDLGAYRYDVFVRRLGWTIAGHSLDEHAEWDEFDGPSTIHVVALDDAREICGYARLLPTTGPYLLRDVRICSARRPRRNRLPSGKCRASPRRGGGEARPSASRSAWRSFRRCSRWPRRSARRAWSA